MNEVLDDSALLRRYKREIDSLRSKLRAISRGEVVKILDSDLGMSHTSPQKKPVAVSNIDQQKKEVNASFDSYLLVVFRLLYLHLRNVLASFLFLFFFLYLLLFFSCSEERFLVLNDYVENPYLVQLEERLAEEAKRRGELEEKLVRGIFFSFFVYLILLICFCLSTSVQTTSCVSLFFYLTRIFSVHGFSTSVLESLCDMFFSLVDRFLHSENFVPLFTACFGDTIASKSQEFFFIN